MPKGIIFCLFSGNIGGIRVCSLGTILQSEEFMGET